MGRGGGRGRTQDQLFPPSSAGHNLGSDPLSQHGSDVAAGTFDRRSATGAKKGQSVTMLFSPISADQDFKYKSLKITIALFKFKFKNNPPFRVLYPFVRLSI